MAAAPLLALLLLAATYLFWHNAEQSQNDRRAQVFASAADRLESNLTDRLTTFEMVLRGIQGYYEGSDEISQEEFRIYFKALGIERTQPDLQDIALLASVPAGQLAQHEAHMRASGLSGYHIHPVEARSLHAPITHLEPLTPDNAPFLGQDAMDVPALRAALLRARDSGGMALSGALRDGPEGSARLVMYLPLYGHGQAHTTQAERERNCTGWVGLRFRLVDVIESLVRESDNEIALAIHDGPAVAGGELLYASRKDYVPGSVNAGLESVRSLDVGGRRWTLVLYPLPSFALRFESASHHVIALMGVAFSLLAGWFLGMQISARRRAVAMAHSMTGELREARDALEDILNAVPDLLLELDAQGRIYNLRTARSNLSYAPSQTQIGSLVSEVLPPQAAMGFMQALGEAAAHDYSEGHQYSLTMPSGTRWFELSVARKESRTANADQPMRFIALVRDVSRRHEAEAAMHHMAHFDALTGMPNRRLLQQQMLVALQAARSHDEPGAVFYVDLDNFKQINDAQGHEVGDALLVQAAQRLRTQAGSEHVVARLGGDEFVVLAPRLGTTLEGARLQALQLAQLLQQSMDAPYEVDGVQYSSSASIGVTLFPKGGESVADLLREADTAMFHAKAQGRNQVCMFEVDMHSRVQERLALMQDLKNAVTGDILQTYAQSQVDGRGRVIGAELLLRWKDARRGFVAPASFIAAAEETGLIERIGVRVLQQACAALAQLQQQGRQLTISVNVSPRQFRQSDFVGQVREALASSGAQAQGLLLEVTEGLLIENWQDTAQRMNELVALGVRFSIDDFGTGYSSLAYLKRLPLYELKIDKSFVQDVPQDMNDATIVKAILSVARHLRLRVVAEGVETQEQVDFLTSNHCDGLQGYLFDRPMPLSDWLARFSS